MRHSKVVNHLGRTSSHRGAMLSNMASSLIKHKRITTTLAKAKALRKFVEPLITKSKDDTTHSRRVVFKYLQDKEAVTELFREVSPKIAERPGGYTRILKIGNRLGDNAEMCIIELVDYNEAMLEGDAGKGKSTRRRRASKKKATDEASGVKAEEVNVEETVEAKVEEAEVIEEAIPVEETPDDNSPDADPVSSEDEESEKKGE